MSFYDDLEKKFDTKYKRLSNVSIENIWNIFKECCYELDVDSRSDLGTYSFIFDFSRYRRNTFSITFNFHIVESENPNERDENFTFIVEFFLENESIIEDLEEDEIEGSKILGSLDSNIKKLENWKTYTLLKNNSYDIKLSKSARY